MPALNQVHRDQPRVRFQDATHLLILAKQVHQSLPRWKLVVDNQNADALTWHDRPVPPGEDAAATESRPPYLLRRAASPRSGCLRSGAALRSATVSPTAPNRATFPLPTQGAVPHHRPERESGGVP